MARTLQASPEKDGFLPGSFSLERLTPAIERVSGRKFGPVPLNPMLSSDTRKIPGLEAQRKDLIAKLAAWSNEPASSQPATLPANSP